MPLTRNGHMEVRLQYVGCWRIETADMAAYIYQRDRWPRRYRVRHARIGAAPPRDAFTFRGALRRVKRWQRRGVR